MNLRDNKSRRFVKDETTVFEINGEFKEKVYDDIFSNTEAANYSLDMKKPYGGI